MEYKIKYKRIGSWFWTTKTIIGSGVKDNRLNLYYKDLTLEEVPKFDELQVKLGNDWKLATQEAMSKESGQDIKVN